MTMRAPRTAAFRWPLGLALGGDGGSCITNGTMLMEHPRRHSSVSYTNAPLCPTLPTPSRPTPLVVPHGSPPGETSCPSADAWAAEASAGSELQRMEELRRALAMDESVI